MRKLLIILTFCASTLTWAQHIPVPLTQTHLYDFLDELLTTGIISHQSTIRPYTRSQVAALLQHAQHADSLLSTRQQRTLLFYLNEFALELDTVPSNYLQYTNHSTFCLSLADPQFSYRTADSRFKLRLRPILGAEVSGNRKGAILHRWYGAELQMDIANHLSIWGSLRDHSWSGNWLSEQYFPDQSARINGARIHYGASQQQSALLHQPGVQYKEASYGGDFSDSRGGISLYAPWGSISLQRENIRWGNAYYASNIISQHAPAAPMIYLQLTPCPWFQFDYFHASLISNVLDTTYYYAEQTTKPHTPALNYRPMNKFMAANMFTFRPLACLNSQHSTPYTQHPTLNTLLEISFGNSIIYAERNIQLAYLIPFAFYKSLDHLLTKGVYTQNQNSQFFASISLRPVRHLHLYSSFYLDEFKLARLKANNPERNPISYLVGFNWVGWPVSGLALKAEFMRSHIACYTHSIPALTYTTNSFPLGHYLGDNAQSIFVELSYRPMRAMLLSASYTCDTKYNSYAYLRVYRGDDGVIRDGGISQTLQQQPFDHAIFRHDICRLDASYEVHPNMFISLSAQYNHAQGFDNINPDAIPSEDTGNAQYYLDKYMPLYYQGRNFTLTASFSFGF